MNGVKYVFGNPGTTEIALVRMSGQAVYPEYVTVLSELAAVAMADGYARATRSLGVVNLHAAPGLGNGMGSLSTARAAKTPLLVLIGAQDRRHLHTRPILDGPLEAMASSVSKAVYTLHSLQDAAFYVEKAIRLALTPPRGPVALICPMDLMEQEGIDERPRRIFQPGLSGLTEEDAELYLRFLTDSQHLAVVASEEVYWDQAGTELEVLARATGAHIYAAPYTGVLPVSSAAQSFAGYLPPSKRKIERLLEAYDGLLFLGVTGLRTTLYSSGELLQVKAWIGEDPDVVVPDTEYKIARVADIKSALRQINAKLEPKVMGTDLPVRPSYEWHETGAGTHPSTVVEKLLKMFSDSLLVDESGLSTTDVRAFMKVSDGDYIMNGSGGIGWALPASVGIQMANPKRTVLALIGDGSAIYGSEAMWTASKHGTRIVLIVFANGQYATLNSAAKVLTNESSLNNFSLAHPAIDFGGLAKMYDWKHFRVAEADDLDRVLQMLVTGVENNTLVEVVLDANTIPITAEDHF